MSIISYNSKIDNLYNNTVSRGAEVLKQLIMETDLKNILTSIEMQTFKEQRGKWKRLRKAHLMKKKYKISDIQAKRLVDCGVNSRQLEVMYKRNQENEADFSGELRKRRVMSKKLHDILFKYYLHCDLQ